MKKLYNLETRFSQDDVHFIMRFTKVHHFSISFVSPHLAGQSDSPCSRPLDTFSCRFPQTPSPNLPADCLSIQSNNKTRNENQWWFNYKHQV